MSFGKRISAFAILLVMIVAAAFATPWEEVPPNTDVNTNLVGVTIGDNLVVTNGVLSATGGGKVDRVEPPFTEDNFAALTAEGGIKDSGKKASDFAPAVEGGYIPAQADVSTGWYDAHFELTAGKDGQETTSLWMEGLRAALQGTKWYYKKGSSDPNDEDELAVKGDLADKLDKAAHELHADSLTNIVWKTCYENGWVFLRAYTNDLEVAQ